MQKKKRNQLLITFLPPDIPRISSPLLLISENSAMVKAICANMMVSVDVYSKTPSDSLSMRDPLSAVLKISANSFGEISGS